MCLTMAQGIRRQKDRGAADLAVEKMVLSADASLHLRSREDEIEYKIIITSRTNVLRTVPDEF